MNNRPTSQQQQQEQEQPSRELQTLINMLIFSQQSGQMQPTHQGIGTCLVPPQNHYSHALMSGTWLNNNSNSADPVNQIEFFQSKAMPQPVNSPFPTFTTLSLGMDTPQHTNMNSSYQNLHLHEQHQHHQHGNIQKHQHVQEDIPNFRSLQHDNMLTEEGSTFLKLDIGGLLKELELDAEVHASQQHVIPGSTYSHDDAQSGVNMHPYKSDEYISSSSTSHQINCMYNWENLGRNANSLMPATSSNSKTDGKTSHEGSKRGIKKKRKKSSGDVVSFHNFHYQQDATQKTVFHSFPPSYFEKDKD